MRPAPAPIAAETREFICDWLEIPAHDRADVAVAPLALRQLQAMGFTGMGKPRELQCGYFFGQDDEPVERPHEVVVFIATEIRWPHGAAALLVEPASGGRYRFCEAGVFVGRVPNTERQSVAIE